MKIKAIVDNPYIVFLVNTIGLGALEESSQVATLVRQQMALKRSLGSTRGFTCERLGIDDRRTETATYPVSGLA